MLRESRRDSNDDGEEEFIQEAGNEAWVDDLINQQPDIPMYSSGEEDEELDQTLIPAIKNSNTVNIGSNNSNQIEGSEPFNSVDSPSTTENPSVATHKPSFVDSTPLPNGCGAIWSPTGQLVCFSFQNQDQIIPQEIMMMRRKVKIATMVKVYKSSTFFNSRMVDLEQKHIITTTVTMAITMAITIVSLVPLFQILL